MEGVGPGSQRNLGLCFPPGENFPVLGGCSMDKELGKDQWRLGKLSGKQTQPHIDPHSHFLLGWGNREGKVGKLMAWDEDLIGKGKATGAKKTKEFLPHSHASDVFSIPRKTRLLGKTKAIIPSVFPFPSSHSFICSAWAGIFLGLVGINIPSCVPPAPSQPLSRWDEERKRP